MTHCADSDCVTAFRFIIGIIKADITQRSIFTHRTINQESLINQTFQPDCMITNMHYVVCPKTKMLNTPKPFLALLL